MKTHQLTLVTLLLTFFLTGNIYGQSPRIDSLKIIPSNPTTNDTVKLIIYTYSSYTPCGLDTIAFDTIGTQIFVSATPILGIGAAICYSIDTLTIGILKAATYELICDLGTDAPPKTYDIDTINFTVQQATGLQLIDNSYQVVKIYPSPTTTEINIDLKTYSANKHDINFYSELGQKVKTVKEQSDIITIDISDLADGVYIIVITNDNNKQWTQKIIKNNR